MTTTGGTDSRQAQDPGRGGSSSNERTAPRAPGNIAVASTRGIVLYTPGNPQERKNSNAAPSFPTPLIQPRQRRPQEIHIISYPPGYIPPDLRPKPAPREKKPKKTQRGAAKNKSNSASPSSAVGGQTRPRRASQQPLEGDQHHRQVLDGLRSTLSASLLPAVPSQAHGGQVTGLQLGPSGSTPPATVQHPTNNNFEDNPRHHELELTRTNSTFLPGLTELLGSHPALIRLQSNGRYSDVRDWTASPSLPSPSTESSSSIHEDPGTMSRRSITLDPGHRAGLLGAHAHNSNSHSMLPTRSASKKGDVSAHVVEMSKPVASGSGVSCSIVLAEPNVFLMGFDHDGHRRHGSSSTNATALLRGKLQLDVTKNVKIKSVALKFVGKARTEWPEGIPPQRFDIFEEQTLRNQVLTFFNATTPVIWQTEYGNQCTFHLKNNSDNAPPTNADGPTTPTNAPHHRLSLHSTHSSAGSIPIPIPRGNAASLTARELKRLSLQSAQSRSYGRGDSPLAAAAAAAHVSSKGYKVFYPGTYEYSFELPIDHHQLETTKLQFGSVKWEVEAVVERAGAFKPTLHGTKEVSIVRIPDQLSLETSEPISISRQWEDQLHYDIIISGKSFPIGGKIPIAFKLTPLAKVQLHKLKVYVTESIEYWTNDHRVTRKDPGRKILLLEKAAGRGDTLGPQFAGSEVRVLSGGELTSAERSVARANAWRRRANLARRTGTNPRPLPEPTDNLLGDLDLGLETLWASTEIEMNVQIPTCQTMARDKSLRLHPDCSWKNVNVYHWIKIVMRISRADPDDPTGQRRRHFEISIDSPFTVLDCRATQANTSLPSYPDGCASEGGAPHYRQPASCGCPDAQVLSMPPSPTSSTGTLTMTASPDQPEMPTAPPAAHVHRSTTSTSSASNHTTSSTAAASSASSATASTSAAISPNGTVPLDSSLANTGDFRPIHLLRHPSFNPPAFDADVAPPPAPVDDPLGDETDGQPRGSIMTPPPRYDSVVGTPSVDGLADYFARLASYDQARRGSRASMASAAARAAATGTGNAAAAAAAPPSVAEEDEPRSPGSHSTASAGMGGAASSSSDEDGSDDDDEHVLELALRRRRLTERSGRVNVGNPRTPGAQTPAGGPDGLTLVTSRSFEIERPTFNPDLSLASIGSRRREAPGA